MVVKKSYFNISAYESWFENKSIAIRSAFLIYNYRYSFVESKNPLFIKDQKYTIINNLQNDLDDIFSSFKKISRSCINKINKVENITYKIDSITDEDFLVFYNNFANKKNLKAMDDYKSSKYNDHILYLSGYIDNELCNIHVYIFDNEKKIVRFLYSISSIYNIDDTKKRNLVGCINRYLYWKAICFFHKKNYLFMDMGGYANDKSNKQTEGIDQYKKSFSGEIVKIYNYESYPHYILLKIKSFFKKVISK